MAERHMFGCISNARRMMSFKNTLVYWGEEKDSALRPLGKDYAWGRDQKCGAC